MAKEAAMPHVLLLDHVSPATRLLEKRRQMFEVQEALDAQKEEFARKEEAFRHREEALRKKDLDLQESLIRFNKFLQENEAKRNRAEKRAAEETDVRKTKEGEITELESQLDALRKRSAVVEDLVRKNMKYLRYLESVQEATGDEYTEISGLLDRYKTLTDAHADLEGRQRETMVHTEAQKARVTVLRQAKSQEALQANNIISNLKNELEEARELGVSLQQQADDQVDLVSSRSRVLGQVLHAVENLLQRCTSKRHGAHLKHTETPKTDDDHGKGLGLFRKTPARGEEPPAPASSSMVGSPALDIAAMDAKMLARRGQKAMADLRVIASYIADFSDLVVGATDDRAAKMKPEFSGSALGAGSRAGPGTHLGGTMAIHGGGGGRGE